MNRMRVIEDIATLGAVHHPVVTVGSFDGVHIGHQTIIEETTHRARLSGGISILVTFEPHPQVVIDPQGAPRILTTKEEKLELLGRTDLDTVCILSFSDSFSRLGPHDFVQKILVEKIGMKEIVIGQNHAFGKNREGTAADLMELGRAFDFSVHPVSPVKLDGRRVSSSWIRETLVKGDVRRASRLLGRLYSFSGLIVHGHARGRALHYPTANIQVVGLRKLWPADGVYAIWAHLNHDRQAGMMNIGERPTFGTTDRTIEVHLFDFRGDIYGRGIQIEVAKRIRDEIQFGSENELVTQIEKDRSKTLRILSRSSLPTYAE